MVAQRGLHGMGGMGPSPPQRRSAAQRLGAALRRRAEQSAARGCGTMRRKRRCEGDRLRHADLNGCMGQISFGSLRFASARRLLLWRVRMQCCSADLSLLRSDLHRHGGRLSAAQLAVSTTDRCLRWPQRDLQNRESIISTLAKVAIILHRGIQTRKLAPALVPLADERCERWQRAEPEVGFHNLPSMP